MAVALAAAWDAFSTAAELCDLITFDEGSDELQAMVAARKCMEGRDLLPLPEAGEPVPASRPGPGAAGLAPYIRLLKHVSESLTRLSVGEEPRGPFGHAGGLAAGAAVALSLVRER